MFKIYNMMFYSSFYIIFILATHEFYGDYDNITEQSLDADYMLVDRRHSIWTPSSSHNYSTYSYGKLVEEENHSSNNKTEYGNYKDGEYQFPTYNNCYSMNNPVLSGNSEIKASNKTKNTGIYTDRQKRKIMLWNKESAEKYKKLYNNGDGSAFLSSDDESCFYEDNKKDRIPERDISDLEEKLPVELFTTLDSELFSNHIQDINIDDNIWNRPSDLYSLDNDMPAENFIGELTEEKKFLRKYKKGLKNVFLERYTQQ